MKLFAVILALALTTIPAQATDAIDAGICNWGGGLDVVAWSPDGATLAGAVIHESTSCANATLVVTDGHSFRELEPYSSASAQTLQWSPDGRRLAVGWAHSQSSLDLYDIASGAKTTLARGVDPAWAPDGRTIAYTNAATGALHLIAPNGTGDRRIASGDRPAWSPDSTRIAYHRAGSIYVAPSDGAAERRLAAGTHASWSPADTAVAIVRRGATYLHPLDGSRERRLGRGEPMQWSPSGHELALLTRTNNFRIDDFRGVVRLADVRSGQSRRIAEDVEAAAFRPQWDRLATVLRIWLEPELYVAEATGARPHRISPSQCGQETRHCVDGSDGADRIVGSEQPDRVFAGAGDDRVWGRGGYDHIATSYGRDFVVGGPGNDTVVTHGNDDRLYGGPGDDHLTAGNGEDFVDGGPGNDWIRVAGDGRVDRVRCGSGQDGGYADRIDRVARDCEQVKPPPS